MYQPPFRRKIIPWLYVGIFVIVAPLLVFYTAGYRYNLKKGQVERNGTLIVDTTPSGANIFLDDQDTGKKTPYTFQNVIPGTHKIRIVKAGYQEWIKRLDVRAEQVTFANNVWLWQQSPAPQLLLSGNFSTVAADPSREKIALITSATGSPALAYYDTNTTAINPIPIQGSSAGSPLTIRWREDGQALAINGTDDRTPAWWDSAATPSKQISALPKAVYHWASGRLTGSDRTHLYRIDPITSAFSEANLAAGTIDQSDALSLSTDPKTQDLLLTDKSFLTKKYLLPAGAWRFGEILSQIAFLVDNGRWLAVNIHDNPPTMTEVAGDVPRWLTRTTTPQALFINQNELWLWSTADGTSLLRRQSEPLIQARWHQSGTSVLIATAQKLFILGLDERDGRTMTPIATFDRIDDFDLIGTDVYVSGVLNGQSGLWSVSVE